jgi:hypothetical protein
MQFFVLLYAMFALIVGLFYLDPGVATQGRAETANDTATPKPRLSDGGQNCAVTRKPVTHADGYVLAALGRITYCRSGIR